MLVPVDAVAAERARKEHERRERYEATAKARERKKRYNAANSRKGERHDGAPLYSQYPFVMWDGEAPKDTGYSLFGSSLGHEICKPHLTTEECFDLLLQAKEENPHAIFIIFGGRYDFDEICRQSMPSDRLNRLKKFGHCTWHGYRIKQADGKFFTLKRDGVSVTVFEIFGWFHKAYVKALADYEIGTVAERELLSSEKNRRAEFMWAEINEIREYMRLELKLGPPLMDKIREICLQAGFSPRNWYGPSALALDALKANRITDYMGTVPSVVKRASQYAYAGGRFEGVRGGILSPVCAVDENSAYMAAALLLPDLAHGDWRRGCEFEPGKFGLYHIRYDARNKVDPLRPWQIFPLFMRHENGSVTWPVRVEGWYWAPEAELVANDPDAEFLEAYIYDEANPAVRPFSFVREWYRKRLFLESLPESNPSRKAGKAFKWALASVYGQLARAVGWDRFRRLPPKYHQLEWAGFITSKCRADMYRAAKPIEDYLISIDTDSVTAMCPIEVPLGKEIGEWKETRADRGVFYQSGVFALEVDGEWIERKARGMEEDRITRRLPVSPEMMISAIYDGKAIELKPRTRYISVRMALAGQFKKIGQWVTHPADKLVFGGNGKRIHRPQTCWNVNNGNLRVCESADSHVFSPRPGITYTDWVFGEFPKSQPHLLPWIDDVSDQLDKELIADILWIDPENIDEDDEWVRQLIPA